MVLRCSFLFEIHEIGEIMRGLVDFGADGGASIIAALTTAAAHGPMATEVNSGAPIVLRHGDVERLARDSRLAGIGLMAFDLMGITGGPLRDWYGGLMFTTEGDVHHRLRALASIIRAASGVTARASLIGPSSR